LVTGTDLLGLLGEMSVHTLGNVGALLLDVDKHLAVGCIQTDVVEDEPNLTASVSHDLLVVNLGLGGDFTEHHHHVGLGACLTCYLAFRVRSRQASRTASEIWSQSLSGCPSLTDSEVKRKVSIYITQINYVS
jgi:hypothetical protein